MKDQYFDTRPLEFFSREISNYVDKDSVFHDPQYELTNLLLATINLDEKRYRWTTYSFNGFNVPRVTEIISSTIGKNYLNDWAAKLGDSYKSTKNRILDTGSLIHKYIEDFILTGTIDSDVSNEYKNANQLEALKAFHNFKNFWTAMKYTGYKIEPLAIETPFATPWFGGTIDFIANIYVPGDIIPKLYILDFKSSKSISYEYYLQLMLYAQAYTGFLRYNPQCGIKDYGELSGIGIIRVDKEKDKYEYVFVDIKKDFKFINELSEAAAAMVNWYYNMNNIDLLFKDFRQKYKEGGGINGLYRRGHDDI